MEKETEHSFFDALSWHDPLSGKPLIPVIVARTPAGVPVCGALRIEGTEFGYPIVDCVARLTPELAHKHRSWLKQFSLQPPPLPSPNSEAFQAEDTVDSFGWQWTWNCSMRSEADLRMRVADKFNVTPAFFKERIVVDAGAGAGDQSRYLLRQEAKVVSVDLSSAIDVVAGKLRMEPNWVGVQGDIMRLPFAEDQFDVVYCEGVIQHTADSVKTVKELRRILKPGGHILAAHYIQQPVTTLLGKLKRKVTSGYYNFLRSRLSRMERFKLLFVTGLIAALNYIPLLGYVLRKTGTVLYYALMPDFKTTWTNTYDYYGAHTYQRFISLEEFCGYFKDAGNIELVYAKAGNVLARKIAKEGPQ